MKLVKSLLVKLLVLALLTTLTLSKLKHKRFAMRSRHRTHAVMHHRNSMLQMVNSYASNARDYASFARLAYCGKNLIQDLSCSFCNNFTGNSYATFFIHSVMKENNRLFQFAILYSDLKREVVVTFSGPGTEHGNYFNSLYESGFIEVPELGGVKVEREYWEVYSTAFRQILNEKIHTIASSNRAGYTFILVGHSFGGSLATLASYDLVMNGVIIKTETSPLVYTYGQLRIGDSEFVNRVNNSVRLVKIMRNDDYVTRMPNCMFQNGMYRCYNNPNTAMSRFPTMRRYVHGYGGFRRAFAGFLSKKDPIVRGTRFINGRLHAVQPMYTQPLGTPIYYHGANFANHQACRYVNGIPMCEKNMRLPHTFSPDVHRMYYNTNLENC